MELSKRLLSITEMIEYKNIIDVGTDHCYIPIYMLKNGLAEKAVAGDLNRGPLDKAKENIDSYLLSHKIELRLGGGLSIAYDHERLGWCAVIAGMGGFLICEILDADKEKINKFSQIIVQPQSNINDVRKKIHELSLRITDEKTVFDAGKYYHIISCGQGTDEDYEEIDYILGKININKKDPVFMDYVKYEFEKTERILKNIRKNSLDAESEKVRELEKLLKMYKEVL